MLVFILSLIGCPDALAPFRKNMLAFELVFENYTG